MQEDEEEPPKEVENSGPKIKMTRIRKKKNQNAPGPKGGEEEKKKTGGAPDAFKVTDKPTGSGGFTEQDIEFMKKAIQVLC